MQLAERVAGDVIVLAPCGRMTRNEAFGAVKHRLHDLIQEGRRKLVMGIQLASCPSLGPSLGHVCPSTPGPSRLIGPNI